MSRFIRSLFPKKSSAAADSAESRTGSSGSSISTISAPYEAKSVVHVVYDPQKKALVGLPDVWRRWLEHSITLEERKNNPEAVKQALVYMQMNFNPDGTQMLQELKFMMQKESDAANSTGRVSDVSQWDTPSDTAEAAALEESATKPNAATLECSENTNPPPIVGVVHPFVSSVY